MSPAREEVHVDVEGRTLRLSNLDKVLFPRTGTTKGEVLHYYAQVAPTLLPHLADRAVTRIRWPHGVAEGSFFEKNVPQGTPSWVAGVPRRAPRTGWPRCSWGSRPPTGWSTGGGSAAASAARCHAGSPRRSPG